MSSYNLHLKTNRFHCMMSFQPITFKNTNDMDLLTTSKIKVRGGRKIQLVCAGLLSMMDTDRDVHSRISNPSKPVPNYEIKIDEICHDALFLGCLCMNVSAHALLTQ